PLSRLGLDTGKKARLHRILYQHGLRNGTALFLPYDQGLEHGPRDFFANPASGDPAYIAKLAAEGGFNGIAVQVDYAARTASELGADVVKVNFPHPDKRTGVKAPYYGEFSSQRAIDAVVRSANRTLVLVSGGSK